MNTVLASSLPHAELMYSHHAFIKLVGGEEQNVRQFSFLIDCESAASELFSSKAIILTLGMQGHVLLENSGNIDCELYKLLQLSGDEFQNGATTPCLRPPGSSKLLIPSELEQFVKPKRWMTDLMWRDLD